MFSKTIKKARRFVNHVVLPRPLVEFPTSDRCLYCHYAGINSSTTIEEVTSPRGILTMLLIYISTHQKKTIAIMTPLCDTVASVLDCPEVASDRNKGLQEISSSTNDIQDPCQTPQNITVGESLLYLEQRYGDLITPMGRSDIIMRRRLRRSDRRISRAPGGFSTTSYTYDDSMDHSSHSPQGTYGKADVQGLPTRCAEGGTSYSSSLYVTARSDFTRCTEVEDSMDCTPILQVVDTNSGAVFEKVLHGNSGEVFPAEILLANDLDNIPCRVVPSICIGATSGDFGWLGTLVAPVPSFTLTLPTPRLPSSPIFVPQSPITVSKFVSASAITDLLAPQLSPVPAIPACDQCCFSELEVNPNCRVCYQQWLACKVWYQANDGGRRQRLTEPYIKPGESNARNRAMLDLLGTPPRFSRSCGLGIKAMKFMLRLTLALERLFAISNGHGELDSRIPQKGKPAFAKIALRATGALLGRLWVSVGKILCSRARQIPRIFWAPLDRFARTVLSYDPNSCSTSHEQLFAPLRHRDDHCLGLAASTSTSRFVEHIPV
ncbi:hypothetical protein B0H21DRAFT_720572 [Amylocystis lapponica]|nr:hypothetical protein B0H21DRAFT_720572 [Amylocystis lapponica]